MNKKQNEKLLRIAEGFATPTDTPSPSKAIGRPKTGKSSNPDYVAVTIYIKKSTKKAVDTHIVTRDDPRDFSEISQDALAEWLERQKANISAD